MKKILTICAGVMLCTATYATAIPINESDAGLNLAGVQSGDFNSVGFSDSMPGNADFGLGIATGNTYSGQPSTSLDKWSWKDLYTGWWRDNPRWFTHPVVCPVPAPGDGGGNQNPVPEPATMLLFGAGLAGLAGFSRRRMKNA